MSLDAVLDARLMWIGFYLSVAVVTGLVMQWLNRWAKRYSDRHPLRDRR